MMELDLVAVRRLLDYAALEPEERAGSRGDKLDGSLEFANV